MGLFAAAIGIGSLISGIGAHRQAKEARRARTQQRNLLEEQRRQQAEQDKILKAQEEKQAKVRQGQLSAFAGRRAGRRGLIYDESALGGQAKLGT